MTTMVIELQEVRWHQWLPSTNKQEGNVFKGRLPHTWTMWRWTQCGSCTWTMTPWATSTITRGAMAGAGFTVTQCMWQAWHDARIPVHTGQSCTNVTLPGSTRVSPRPAVRGVDTMQISFGGAKRLLFFEHTHPFGMLAFHTHIWCHTCLAQTFEHFVPRFFNSFFGVSSVRIQQALPAKCCTLQITEMS